ncbi:MAG: molybdopterin dinucleotide binding domain-containing protein, partial [Pseudomonadota bacterium]
DQWHTMTRTGRAPRLNRHMPEPFAHIHPKDAEQLNLKNHDLIRLSNKKSTIVVRTIIEVGQERGDVFVPMHWTRDTASNACVDTLVTPSEDPFSGQPALKSSSVTIEPFNAQWHGFALSLNRLSPGTDYWARVVSDRGERAEIAGLNRPENWRAFAQDLLCAEPDAQFVESNNSAGGAYRCALFISGRLTGLLITGTKPVVAAKDWLADQIGRVVPVEERLLLLSGYPPKGFLDPGPIVCSCLGVGRNTIREAIKKGASNPTLIGECTGAGTNCGSCRSELRQMLEDANVTTQA